MLERFHAFVTGITTCYRYIQRIKSMEMTELGLRGTHAMCLFYLCQAPQGLTATQLCQLCGEDKAAISRTLSELQERGYLYAQPEAGKKYRARLLPTQQGREIGARLEALAEEWVQAGGDGLTEAQRADFYSSLDRIAENLRERMDQAQP